MVHRDPETGQFVTGSDGEMVEYADHEVQGLSFQIVSEGGNDEAEIQAEPVSERGIDSDELAELVAMFRTVSLKTQGAQDVTNDNGDSLGAEVNLGINTTGKEEALTDAPANATIEQFEDGGTVIASLGEIDDPGLLDAASMSGNIGSTPQGLGERFINFRETFGSGPYVDRTDDLVFQGEAGSVTSGNGLQVEANYLLYWSVEEMPEGRASFARP